jgi:processive 1,2-diacylglycerol beta-glucosyltransferase
MDTIIFSASVGAGHNQVSKALQEEILRRYPAARVAIVDTISYISPMLNRVVLEGYLGMVRYTPKAYGKLYQTTETDSGPDLVALPNRLLARALTRAIRDYSPQTAICTHAFSSGLIGTLKRRKRIACQVTTVITDFTVHSYWVHPGNDLYCIAHENLDFLMHDLGVPADKVASTGIPILRRFRQPIDQNEVRQKHDLAKLPTILVMGGSLGLGHIQEIVKQLDDESDGVQILVVTGRNEILRNELDRHQWRNRCRIYGFVDYIHELMAVSDLVLTKPGGVTSAEALSQAKPIVVISPIPGQEDRNSDFLTEQGAAIRLMDDRYAGVKIAQLLRDQERLEILGQMARRLAKPTAAERVIDLIEAQVRNQKTES